MANNSTLSSTEYNSGYTSTSVSVGDRISLSTNESSYTYIKSVTAGTADHYSENSSDWQPVVYVSKNASSTIMPLVATLWGQPQGNNGWTDLEYGTTKTFKLYICGGTHHGKIVTLGASSATKYTYAHSGTGSSATYAYDAARAFYFAGGTSSNTTSGTASSNLVRTFRFDTASNCKSYTPYTSTSATRTVYYRPLIRVVKN